MITSLYSTCSIYPMSQHLCFALIADCLPLNTLAIAFSSGYVFSKDLSIVLAMLLFIVFPYISVVFSLLHSTKVAGIYTYLAN